MFWRKKKKSKDTSDDLMTDDQVHRDKCDSLEFEYDSSRVEYICKKCGWVATGNPYKKQKIENEERLDTEAEKSRSIPISGYFQFFMELAESLNTTDPEVILSWHSAYCDKCNTQFSKEALKMLQQVQSIAGLFGGADIGVINATNDGNDLRSGKCPYCGETTMRIEVK